MGHQRVKADVEVYRCDQAAGIGPLHQIPGLLDRNGQRLLTEHVFARGQDILGLRVVQVVRGTDVHRVELLERLYVGGSDEADTYNTDFDFVHISLLPFVRLQRL